MKGVARATIQWQGHEIYFTVIVYGKSWSTPEKRVSGNYSMIESYAESGVSIRDFDYDELLIDNVPVNLNCVDSLLDEEIEHWVDKHENEIKWDVD